MGAELFTLAKRRKWRCLGTCLLNRKTFAGNFANWALTKFASPRPGLSRRFTGGAFLVGWRKVVRRT